MKRVFIGFDPKEIAAFQICAYSIWKNASEPVSITPLNIRQIPNFKNTDYKASTEFAFTRFLVPYLCEYGGTAVFMDCDMLVLGDIVKLFAASADDADVSVVKHLYEPKAGNKFLGQEQTTYDKKNWSSVMVFNNALCKRLSKHYVNTTAGLLLHQFDWAREVAALPPSWNYLVDEGFEPDGDVNLVHYTRGGPYFAEYANCGFAKVWREYWQEANSVLDRKILGVGNV